MISIKNLIREEDLRYDEDYELKLDFIMDEDFSSVPPLSDTELHMSLNEVINHQSLGL